MGLTIHLKLSLPSKTTFGKVVEKVEKLRQALLDMPFAAVDKELTIRKNCTIKRGDNSEKSWFFIQAGCDETVPRTVIGFSTLPAEGTESADFGLTKEKIGEWKWSSFCKTQYANDPRCGGLQNFLRGHLLVIAALDKAKEIGFEVMVNDEGGYWEKRDVEALSKEIGEWDAFIAGMSVALGQAMKGSELTMESAMDGRPDREILEHRGLQANPALLKLIEGTKKKPELPDRG